MVYLSCYLKKNNKYDVKINRSNLTKGIYKNILYAILSNNLNESDLDRFCRSYIKII